ncbi:MAG: hypothetical protein WAZ36_06315 [Sediminibacterium sp.]
MLRKFVSILLIVTFLLQSASQLWIWAAFEINRDFIADNLCINRFDAIPLCKGSCVLEKTLNENQDRQQKSPDLKAKVITLFCQNSPFELPSPVCMQDFNGDYIGVDTSLITSRYLRSIFRPPDAIV